MRRWRVRALVVAGSGLGWGLVALQPPFPVSSTPTFLCSDSAAGDQPSAAHLNELGRTEGCSRATPVRRARRQMPVLAGPRARWAPHCNGRFAHRRPGSGADPRPRLPLGGARRDMTRATLPTPPRCPQRSPSISNCHRPAMIILICLRLNAARSRPPACTQ